MVHYLLQSAADSVTTVVEQAAGTAPVTEGIMGNAWFITGIGMAILFASLLILWGVMELLVRIAKDKPEAEVEEVAEVATVSDAELKTRAAAAAAASIQNYDLKTKVAAAAAGFVFAKK